MNVRAIHFDESVNRIKVDIGADIIPFAVLQEFLTVTITILSETNQFRLAKHGEEEWDTLIVRHLETFCVSVADENSEKP